MPDNDDALYIPPTVVRHCIEALSKEFSGVKLRVIDASWMLGGPAGKLPIEGEGPGTAIYHFLFEGRKHEEESEAEGLTKEVRSWRVFPALRNGDMEIFRTRLTAKHFQRVESWIKNGA